MSGIGCVFAPQLQRHRHGSPGLTWLRDPRDYQIGSLLLLLSYGLFWLHFDQPLVNVAFILFIALATQYAATRLWRLPIFEWKSALISSLSLCLLLRTNSIYPAGIAAALAILGKFILRFDKKHIFNPTNFAIVVMLLFARESAWVSPGQWGDFAFFVFLVICLGGFVVLRAARADVTIAFLLSWAGLLMARSAWLGEPFAIPLHRLQNGGLLIFAFFMISDPKTTPNSRAGRILFAMLVALGAAFVQFRLFRTNGLLWSLAVFSILVPLIDRALPGPRYDWRNPAFHPVPTKQTTTIKGENYVPMPV